MATETWWPTATPLPSVTPWPTISAFPSSTPYPSITPYPTITDDEGLLDDDISEKTFVDLNAQNNNDVDSRAPPPGPAVQNEEDPLGNLIQDFMNDKKTTLAPTITPVPTITPFPTITAFPSQTAFPTESMFPTTADEKYDESIDEEIIATTSSPVAITNSPTRSPILPPTDEATPINSPEPQQPAASPTKADDQPHNVTPEGSLGHTRVCDNYVPAATQVTTRIVFTYLIESVSSSFDFVTEMELHLLDHVAADALQCNEEGDRVILYKIAYPENVPATESSSCEPESPGASSCWIFQTDMLVTTEEPSVVSAKSNMLFYLRDELDGGALLTSAFPDFVVSRYLGPDPVESTFEGTGYTNVMEGDDDGDTSTSSSHVLSLVATVCVSLAAVSVCAFLATYVYYRDRRQKQHQNIVLDAHMRDINIHPQHPSHHYPGNTADTEMGSVSDLLRKSKERLETIPISPLGNPSANPPTEPSTTLRFFRGFRRHKNLTQKRDQEHHDMSHLLTESARRVAMSPKQPTNNNTYEDEDDSTSRRSWEQNRVFVRTDYASDSSTGIVSNKSKSSRRSKKKKKKRPSSSSNLLVSGNSGRTSRGRNNRSFLPPESPGGGATTTVSNLSGESWEDETQEELLRDRSRRQVKRERPKILKKNSSRNNRDYEDEDDHVNLDPRFEII